MNLELFQIIFQKLIQAQLGLMGLSVQNLKQIMILGNFVVAALLAISVLIIGVFDLFPATTLENQAQMASLFSILTDYALFAFMINFIREIVKDIEDVNGDYNQGMNTLPIAIGINRAAKIALGFAIIAFILLALYSNTYFMQNKLYIVIFYAFVPLS